MENFTMEGQELDDGAALVEIAKLNNEIAALAEEGSYAARVSVVTTALADQEAVGGA